MLRRKSLPVAPDGEPPAKRLLDVCAAILILPVVGLLILAVVIWIKAVSRGSAIFKQRRVGRMGRMFTIYKLRTMEVGACPVPHRDHVRRLIQSGCPMTKLDCSGDPRFIHGGHFLRSSGLDELPQLLNVLSGEMTLVGPRPCLPFEYPFYSRRQRGRFNAKPGMTGLWQVMGRNRVNFRRMCAMDLHYGSHISLLVDLGILMRTPLAVTRQLKEDWRRHSRIGAGVLQPEPELWEANH